MIISNHIYDELSYQFIFSVKPQQNQNLVIINYPLTSQWVIPFLGYYPKYLLKHIRNRFIIKIISDNLSLNNCYVGEVTAENILFLSKRRFEKKNAVYHAWYNIAWMGLLNVNFPRSVRLIFRLVSYKIRTSPYLLPSPLHKLPLQYINFRLYSPSVPADHVPDHKLVITITW